MKTPFSHAAVNAVVTRTRLPGLVVCRFDREQVETDVWGYRDLAAGEPMSADTLFPIASVTKTFTAHLLQRAAESGLLDLNEPIRSAWPGFTAADDQATREMSARDALGHLSGLPPHTWAWVFGDVSRATFFQERFPHLSAVGPFREKHRYSNLLYAALGQLLEEVSGQPWETGLESEILRPLGLNNTRPLTEDWSTRFSRLARPHRDAAPPQPIPPFAAQTRHLIAPASELLSTGPDLARWGQFLLTLSPEDVRWQAVSTISPGLHYGLGWRLESVDGVRRVWHSGQCSGYTSLLSLWPEQGRGTVLLCNRSGAVEALHAIERGDFDIELPPPPELIRPSSPPASPDSLRIPLGTYSNPGYGELTFFEHDGHVWSRFQNRDAVEVLQDETGRPVLQLPVYGVRFPLRVEAERLYIPFEPALPEIVFIRS